MNWCEKVKKWCKNTKSSRIKELEEKVYKLEKELLWKDSSVSLLQQWMSSAWGLQEDTPITVKQVVQLLADKLEVYPTTTESKVVLEERSKPKKSKKGNK